MLAQTRVGSSVTLQLHCTDPDPGQTVTLSLQSSALHGTFGAIDQRLQRVTYTGRSQGLDTFTVTASDGWKTSSAVTGYVFVSP
jgi:hypothetical protein